MSTQKTVRFKKWANKPWAIFNSLNKYLKILMLATSYFLLSNFTLQAQTDTVSIEEIKIESNRTPMLWTDAARVIHVITKNDIAAMPVHSVEDLLENVSGIDVRQRGQEGVQADISMRGGTFEQTLILINGFKMLDAQTGHHNMNLPIDISNVERIEILEGPGNRTFGTNAYSGAINIITSTKKSKHIRVAAYGGENKYFGKSASLSYNIGKWRNNISFSDKSCDGYISDSINNTDFNILNVFYETALKHKSMEYMIQSGYTEKQFGANSFYTPKFPYQYEATKTLFTGFKAKKNAKRFTLTNSFYWRQNKDRFELFREDLFKRKGNYFVTENQDTAKFYPGIYKAWNYYSKHNYHRTNLINGEVKLNFKSLLGRTAIGVEYNQVWLKSNVLGEDADTLDVKNSDFGKYTKAKDRYNVNLYFEQLYHINRFDISAGYSANYNNSFNWNYSGGIDVSYKINNDLKISATINQAIRLPSFTDLYYDGPENIGNVNLKPEHSLTYEVVTKFHKRNFMASINLFRRDGTNTIDWVKLKNEVDSPKVQWQPRNITDITTYGAQFTANYRFLKNSIIRNINFTYTYLDLSSNMSSEYVSHYVFDYLKHKASFSINFNIYRGFGTTFRASYEDRMGSFSVFDLKSFSYTGEKEYLPFLIADAKAYWKNKYIEVYVEASNLFDTKYNELGNIQMPGRWIKAGIILNLNLEKK